MRIPLFGRRRRDATTSQLVLTKWTAAPIPSPPPQPRELIDVVGLGLTETVGGVTLTLLSVERYREGHIALFRLFRSRGRFEMEFHSPHLDLAVTPQGQEPYRFWMMSGGGGGGMREIEYRQSYAIVPAPPADAAEIVIEVREIAWEHWDAGTRKLVATD